MGEVGLAVLFWEKVYSAKSIALPEISIFKEIMSWLLFPFQTLVTAIFLIICWYSYGKLAVIFGNKDIGSLWFLTTLVLSLFIFGMFILIE